ncbi:MAG: hypothetical protein JRI80_08885 [Deltaproteobacteria bacterium]|nr:hypothetical protein [Deltaproteobacteria bacterium]
MDNSFVDTRSTSFHPETYIRILIAIAKADKDNGPREFDYVRKKAQRLGIDYERVLASTEKNFNIEKQAVSRATALAVLRDAIMLASMDHHFSLPERERIYTFAAKMDISRRDLEHLEEWLEEYRDLRTKWNGLVAGAF